MSTMFRPSLSSANALLSSVSEEEYQRLVPHLHPIVVSLGDVIGDLNGQLGFAYFPLTCVVSLICGMENGSTSEVALTGREGILGTSIFLGGNTATNVAVVGIAGEAMRVDGRILREHFTRGGTLQRALLRYTESLIAQISLTAACNRIHTLEKRLCRWLLLVRDRTTSDDLIMTQEFIANILGGRRETVTVAAGRLQDAGLIHYTRGHLRILDRKGLEEAVCECYRAMNIEPVVLRTQTNGEPQHYVHELPERTRLSKALS